MKFCANYPRGPDLEAAFASLSISSSNNPSSDAASKPPSAGPAAGRKVSPMLPAPGPEVELGTILMAMRKLRESITATKRTDSFAQRAYIFILHSTLLASAWESYMVTILYLLDNIHPVTPLPVPELHEVLSYHILDLACRQGSLNEAFRQVISARRQHHWADRKVERITMALATDDWVTFWRLRRQVDGYQRAIMSFAEEGMRTHVLKCLGRSYLQADKDYVERSTSSTWDELVANGVGWDLVDGEKVIIRKPKAKAPG